jgi:cobalt-zinc-cadmium efflux system outer membrane protein
MVGCQTYEARPLDLASHRDAYLRRTADAPGVLAFSKQLGAAVPPPRPFDPADGLSLHEAEAVALYFNPDLRIARLRAGVAAAGVPHAGRWDDPVLGVDLARILSGACKPWILGGAISLTLPLSGRLEAEKARAGAASEAELRRVVAQEWALRADLRRAWVEWSAAVLRVRGQREHLTRLDELLKLVDRLEAAGEYTKVDARVFRIERLTVTADLALLEGREAQAQLELRRLMGLSSTAPLQLVADITRQPAAMTPEARRAAMLAHHPELATLKAEYEVAEAALRKEIRAQFPDLIFGPGGSYDEGDVKALLSLSLPLPLWNRNQRGVAEAFAQRELARAQAEAGYERLAAALDAAELQHRAAASARQRMETQIAPAVDEQVADARHLAAAGRLDPLLILDAMTRQHDARKRLIDSRAAESAALIRLEELTGP